MAERLDATVGLCERQRALPQKPDRRDRVPDTQELDVNVSTECFFEARCKVLTIGICPRVKLVCKCYLLLVIFEE
jgi:hypothetical protein